MTLERRTVNLQLVGGLNEHVDPRVAVSPLVLKNCRYDKAGSLSKRPGSVAIARFNSRYNASVAPSASATPPTPQLLTTRGADELVRMGGGELDTITSATAAASKDHFFRGNVPMCVLRKTGRVAGALTAGDLAIGTPTTGPYVSRPIILTAYPVRAPSSTTTAIYLDVEDSASKTMLMSRALVVSGTTVGVTCKVSVARDFAFVFYIEGTDFKFKVIDLSTTLALSSATTLTTCVSATQLMDATATPGATASEWYVYGIVVDNAGADYKVAVSSSGGAIGTTTVTLNEIDTVAIRHDYLDTYYYILVGNNNGGTETVYGRRFTPGSHSPAAAAFSLYSYASNPNRMQSAIGRISDSLHVYAWSDNVTDTVYWDKRNNSDAAQFTGTTRQLGAAGSASTNSPITLASQPFLVGSKMYACVQTVPFAVDANKGGSSSAAVGQQRATHTVIDLIAEDNSATSTSGRIEATALPGLCYRADAYTAVPKAILLDATTAAFNAGTTDLQTDAPSANIARLTADFTWVPVQAAQVNETAVFAGGQPYAYDGVAPVELGFLQSPFVANTTQSTTGSLTQLGTYQYCAAYAWPDANGNFHLSPPSNVISVTLTGSNDDITNTITCLHATNKKTMVSGVVATPVQIWLYRTLAGGAIFYRQGVYTSTVNGAAVSVLDTTADSTLATNPLLPTTGGVLESQCPPSAGFEFRAQDRVWYVDTDDGSAWFSDVIVPGEAPRFNTLWTIPPPRDGRYTCGSELDQNIVLFTDDNIDVLAGTGPDSTGAGAFSQRFRVASDVGCVDGRSLKVNGKGLWFQSRDGLCVLTRSLEVIRMGKSVEDSTGQSTGSPYAIVAAVGVPDRSEVRFYLDVTNTMRSVVFDLEEAADPSNPASMREVWSVDEHSCPIAGTPKFASACLYQGKATWITTNGYVFQDDASTYLDTATGYTSTWVTQSWQTSHWNSQGVASWMSVFAAGMLAEYLTDHDLTVTLYQDWGTSAAQTPTTWTRAEIATALVGTREQLMVGLTTQKCQAVSVKVTDATPTGGTIGTGRGARYSGVTVEMGPRAAMVPLPAAARK